MVKKTDKEMTDQELGMMYLKAAHSVRIYIYKWVLTDPSPNNFHLKNLWRVGQVAVHRGQTRASVLSTRLRNYMYHHVERPQGAQALAHGLDVMHVGIREQHSKVTARAGHPAWLGQPTWTAVRKKQAPLVKHGLRLDRVVHRGMVVVCFTTANDNSKQFAQDEVLGFLVVVQSYAQFSTAFTV